MSFGKELKDNLTGNVEHAVIIIEDKRMDSAAGMAGAAVSGIRQEVKKKFRVQFNPSSLSLSADRRKNDPKKDVSEKTKAADNIIMDFPKNIMSVKLIFDQVNNQDAFMNENLVLNPTSTAVQITHTVKKGEYTVQPCVDGFIAAIRNPNTRKLTFQWGDFAFIGNLESVSAVYTMFSTSGLPVRAEVTLSVAANRADRDTIGYKRYDTEGLPEKTRSIEKAVIEFENDGTKQRVSVQYNPASVSISAYARDTELKDKENGEDSAESTRQNTNTAYTCMNIDLIFDDVNNLKNIFAFINLLNCSNNRQVTFYWSEFSFRGELTGVNTEFTMFNIMGNPIRGKVSLSIQQDYSDEGVSKNENDRAFDKLFGRDMFTSSETDAKLIKDKAGNLLNLSIF